MTWRHLVRKVSTFSLDFGMWMRNRGLIESPVSDDRTQPATIPLPEDSEAVTALLQRLGVSVKPGVDLDGLDLDLMRPVLEAVVIEFRPPVVITSAVREPEETFSYHHIGRALDFRTRHMEPSERDIAAAGVVARLPSGYDVVLKHDPPHLHVEADHRLDNT